MSDGCGSTLSVYILQRERELQIMSQESHNPLAAQVLRELRERAGLDQSELAARAGLEQPDISKRETGKTRISPGEYEKWDRWLGLKAGEFEERVNAKRRLLDIEGRLMGKDCRDAGVREMQVIQTVLGELAPIVAELARLTTGPERDRLLDRFVAYGEGLVEMARDGFGRHDGADGHPKTTR